MLISVFVVFLCREHFQTSENAAKSICQQPLSCMWMSQPCGLLIQSHYNAQDLSTEQQSLQWKTDGLHPPFSFTDVNNVNAGPLHVSEKISIYCTPILCINFSNFNRSGFVPVPKQIVKAFSNNIVSQSLLHTLAFCQLFVTSAQQCQPLLFWQDGFHVKICKPRWMKAESIYRTLHSIYQTIRNTLRKKLCEILKAESLKL